MFVTCGCCVLSGRGLCDELITRPEESYQLLCVVVCDLENLKNEEAMTHVGSQRHRKKCIYIYIYIYIYICLLELIERAGVGYNFGVTRYVAGQKFLQLVFVMAGFEKHLFDLFEH